MAVASARLGTGGPRQVPHDAPVAPKPRDTPDRPTALPHLQVPPTPSPGIPSVPHSSPRGPHPPAGAPPPGLAVVVATDPDRLLRAESDRDEVPARWSRSGTRVHGGASGAACRHRPAGRNSRFRQPLPVPLWRRRIHSRWHQGEAGSSAPSGAAEAPALRKPRRDGPSPRAGRRRSQPVLPTRRGAPRPQPSPWARPTSPTYFTASAFKPGRACSGLRWVCPCLSLSRRTSPSRVLPSEDTSCQGGQ